MGRFLDHNVLILIYRWVACWMLFTAILSVTRAKPPRLHVHFMYTKHNYKLSNPEGQISSGVVDVFRSAVPQMTLDEVFENKDSVANSISETLAPMMDNYGYKILNALMIDLAPNAQVKASMNEINANKRLRMAAFEKAEAEKIMLIKRAEAEAEAKQLQGQGIARQRAAIVAGIRESVNSVNEKTDLNNKEVMDLLMMTQFFDTLESIGTNSQNAIFLPHNPGSVAEMAKEIGRTFK